MNQILHIFRKDVRHHWPEVLVSLLLLPVFVWHESLDWLGNLTDFSLFQVLLGFVTFLLPLSWCILIVRLIQDESLVGDRQFWVTRPYQWPSLLLSKLLFFITFIHIPLFAAQCILLKLATFAIFPNLVGLLGLQIGLALLFLLPVTLAVVTRSLAHAFLLAISAFFAMLIIDPLISLIPNQSMSGALENSGILKGILVLAVPVAVILWQYARRRTWHSRGVLLAAGAFTLLLDVVTPYRALLEKQYPLTDQALPAPLQLTLLPPPAPPSATKTPSPSLPPGKEVTILIPVHVSGIPADSLVVEQGMFVEIEGFANRKYDLHWQPSGTQFWPEQNSSSLYFSLKRTVYEPMKSTPVRLHLTLALQKFRESSPQEVSLPDGPFSLPGAGFCHPQPGYFPILSCRSPLHKPALIVSSIVTSASCLQEENPAPAPVRSVAREFQSEWNSDFIKIGINPVNTFYISVQPLADRAESFGERARMHLCPGTPIRFATPHKSGRMRVAFEFDQIKLESYEVKNYGSSGARAIGVSSIDLR